MGRGIHDSRKKVAGLSEYPGRQTNNVAEYQAPIGAGVRRQTWPKALKVVSDSGFGQANQRIYKEKIDAS
jgi:hypothetical protein